MIVLRDEYSKKKAPGRNANTHGSSLLTNLSKDLKAAYGKGFGKSNIYLCRQFYLCYPIFQTVSGKLSWSRYSKLLTVSDDLTRACYEKQAEAENWSFLEMKRQIDSSLFERLALNKDKKSILALAEKGQIITEPEDAIKDPYVFEFLGVPTEKVIKERNLESKLIDNLQKFLLELGKGFSFVARQFKITVDN